MNTRDAGEASELGAPPSTEPLQNHPIQAEAEAASPLALFNGSIVAQTQEQQQAATAAPPPPPAYTNPPSAHPPQPAPNPTDPSVLTAVWISQPPPPTYHTSTTPRYEPVQPPVPSYNTTGDLLALTPAQRETYALPINCSVFLDDGSPGRSIRVAIAQTFSEALDTNNLPLMQAVLDAQLVHPDFTVYHGTSALGIASKLGNLDTVKVLVEHGADVNLIFNPRDPSLRWNKDPKHSRTALILAAEHGQLGIVKYLQKQGADDGFIASDGQMALRMAATNGHREIVDILPVRRGGGWLRIKAHYARQWRGIKAILGYFYQIGKFFVWSVPKFLLWNLPKGVLWDLPLATGKKFVKTAKWMWERRAGFPSWCRRRAEDVKRGVKAVPKVLKKVPGAVRDAILEAGRRITRAAAIVGKYVRKWSVRIGSAIGDIAAKVVSLLHTALLLVAGWIQRIRNVSLADLVAGVKAVGRAIVAVPVTVCKALVKLNKAAWNVVVQLFDILGAIVYVLGYGLFQVAIIVPKQLIIIVLRVGSVLLGGVREVLVYFDPKR